MKRAAVIFGLGLLALMVAILLATAPAPVAEKLSQAEFSALLQSNLLAKVRIYYPPKLAKVDGVPVMLHEVRGTFYQTDVGGQVLKAQGIPIESPFFARLQLTPDLEKMLATRTNSSFVSPNPLVWKVSQLVGCSK